jgi:molecular chaperone HscA
LACGIDLGTTNSLVATVQSGEARTLTDLAGNAMLPSVVQYQADSILVGEQAAAAATQDPANTLISVKRFLGKTQISKKCVTFQNIKNLNTVTN